jgi:(2Fe-2S) ferredoxin
MNFFYIEFINGFASELQLELYKEIDEEMADEIASSLYSSLMDYVASNCSEQCENECIINHDENAYCKFCTFGNKKLPCPKEDEISYEEIKAIETDMEH